jgi:hypothetical protein
MPVAATLNRANFVIFAYTGIGGVSARMPGRWPDRMA